MDQLPQPPPVARFIIGVFGFVFAAIGLLVIGFMWSPWEDSFHEPPVFFRIFASLIAIVFVAMGGAVAYSAVTGGPGLTRVSSRVSRLGGLARPQGKTSGYQCPRCGAPLGEGADVSPSGDVKCKHCDAWFNIHHRG